MCTEFCHNSYSLLKADLYERNRQCLETENAARTLLTWLEDNVNLSTHSEYNSLFRALDELC